MQFARAAIPESVGEWVGREKRLDYSYVCDLILLLLQHTTGLRRWSVMRTLRTMRERAGYRIPQRFEEEIEFMFQKFCAVSETSSRTEAGSTIVLFYRPKDRAGEVWAVHPDKAEHWMKNHYRPRRF